VTLALYHSSFLVHLANSRDFCPGLDCDFSDDTLHTGRLVMDTREHSDPAPLPGACRSMINARVISSRLLPAFVRFLLPILLA